MYVKVGISSRYPTIDKYWPSSDPEVDIARERSSFKKGNDSKGYLDLALSRTAETKSSLSRNAAAGLNSWEVGGVSTISQ
jgi:hypothetical protein